jgi:threonine dehydrogenase-like Zn-dependent dehydrogenase
MRALVYHGPNDIGVEERPDPQPGAGEVLLRITATGICGSDLHGYTGENKRRHPGQVMGHETVGRIVAVGADAAGDGREPGRVATVNPVIGCGECAQCAAGSE